MFLLYLWEQNINSSEVRSCLGSFLDPHSDLKGALQMFNKYGLFDYSVCG